MFCLYCNIYYKVRVKDYKKNLIVINIYLYNNNLFLYFILKEESGFWKKDYCL